VGLEVDGGVLVERAVALRGAPADLWLPYWALRCRPQLRGDPQHISRYRLDETIEIFVKGYILRGGDHLGNPGLRLTRDGAPPPRGLPDSPPALVGCRRSRATAHRYAELFLLEILDRQVDITGVELDLGVDATALTGIPFRDTLTHLTCAVTGQQIAAGLFEDIASIRAAAQSVDCGGDTAPR